MRTKLTRFLALSATAALILAGCAQEDTETEPDTDDPAVEDENGDDEDAEDLGLDGCDENPDTCNSGERADGGDITFLVDQAPGAWSGLSPEGGSVYTLQGVSSGVVPFTGQWGPGGEYEHNMDLLAEEPELLNDGEDGEPFEFQFVLRDEAEWDDGTPITADDFRILWYLGSSEGEGHCEGCRSRSSDAFDQIESIEGDDDGKTVTITLKEGESDPEWFGWGSAHGITGGLVPAHVMEDEGWDMDTPADVGEYFEFLNDNMPEWSGGPYMIVEGDLDNQIIKEPNPNWYGEEEPTLDTVILRFLDDEGAWASAMQNREIHGGSPASFPEDVIRNIEELPDVHSHITSGPSWEHIDLNLANPQLEDVELRRAMFTAIDVEEINQRIFGEIFPDIERKTNHFFDTENEYHEDVIGPTGQGDGDVDGAIEILEDAGYELDGDQLTLDGEEIGPFRLRATSNPVRDTSLELIQSMLGEIGIEAQIESIGAADLGAVLGEADYDIIQFGWSGSPFFTNIPAQLFQSESGSNFGGYQNDEVDELVAQVLSSPNLDEAADYTNQVAEIAAEDAYVLPLHESPIFMFVADDYVNIRDNPNSSMRGVYNLEEWGQLAE
jgi:peptide/nickel transport system substrate-binding protein